MPESPSAKRTSRRVTPQVTNLGNGNGMLPPTASMRNPSLHDFGPYTIIRPIATGGMAEIYLARQRAFEGVDTAVSG